MAKINVTAGTASAYGAGELQLQNKAPMDGTLRIVTDNANTASPLKLSTALVQSTSTIKITTSDVAYIDAEDNSGNNRFTVSRASASQLVTVDFASVPSALTTPVGAIRTATDGVNLANVTTFLENGNIGMGTDTPTAKLDIAGNLVVSNLIRTNAAGAGFRQFYNNGSALIEVSQRSDSKLQLYAYTGSAYTDILLGVDGATTGGNVGIGTNAPQFKLEVSGVVGGYEAGGIALKTYTKIAGFQLSSYQSVGGAPYTKTTDLVANADSSVGSELRIFTAPSASNPAEVAKFTSDGYLRLSATSGGIQFNGDTAAANALDDYEEGTWTPVFRQNTTPNTATYTRQDGTYTKIGNLVTVFFDVNASSITAGAGGCDVSGLPFTVSGTMAGFSYASFRDPTVLLGILVNNIAMGFAERTNTYLAIKQINTATGQETAVSSYTASGRLTGTCQYTV